MVAEAQLRMLQCAIALSREGRIAFTRPSNLPAFIDVRGDITAVWGKGAMNIQDKEYVYNQWHTIEGTMKEYFDSLIRSDYEPPFVFGF